MNRAIPVSASRRQLLLGAGASAIGMSFPRWATAQSSHVVRWDPGGCGIWHNRVSDSWAKFCESLPCFKGLAWPGYAEKILYDVRLPGIAQPVIVHLWKGICQKFADNKQWPGGYGAEVGIYLRQPPLVRNDDLLLCVTCKQMQGTGWYLAAGRKPKGETGSTWLPAPELGTKLKFRLLDPENNNATVIETAEIKSYWCTEWLEKDGYNLWAEHRPLNILAKKKDIIHPIRLTLEYSINGREQPRWIYKKGDENCVLGVGCPNDTPQPPR